MEAATYSPVVEVVEAMKDITRQSAQVAAQSTCNGGQWFIFFWTVNKLPENCIGAMFGVNLKIAAISVSIMFDRFWRLG